MKHINAFVAVVLFMFGCTENKIIKNQKNTKEINPSIIRIIINDVDSVLKSEIMFDTVLKQKEGVAKLYHKNGKIKQEGLWQKDKQEGVWNFYDTTGNIESKVSFKNDMQDGESIFYSAKGMVIEKSNWLNGKLNGESSEYYEDGQPKRFAKWIKGKKISEEKYPKKVILKK